jgi:hypothetical protein
MGSTAADRPPLLQLAVAGVGSVAYDEVVAQVVPSPDQPVENPEGFRSTRFRGGMVHHHGPQPSIPGQSRESGGIAAFRQTSSG